MVNELCKRKEERKNDNDDRTQNRATQFGKTPQTTVIDMF